MERPSRTFALTAQRLCRFHKSAFADARAMERASRRVAGLLASHLLPNEVEACTIAVLGSMDADAVARTPRPARSRSRRDKAGEAKHTSRRRRLEHRIGRAQSEHDPAPADGAAWLARRLWSEVVAPALRLDDAKCVREGKAALHAFFCAAIAGDVRPQHLTEPAARAYAVDKWAPRCDKMCCALLCLAERHPTWLVPSGDVEGGILHLASIGGGPGNDAYGAFAFACLSPRLPRWRRIEATVYDVCSVWQPVCEAIGEAAVLQHAAFLLSGVDAQGGAVHVAATHDGAHDSAPTLRLSFAFADLRAAPAAAVNQELLEATVRDGPLLGTSLFLFSHVVKESQACSHELLPGLLCAAVAGAIFVFLDMHRSDLEAVRELVRRVEEGAAPGQAPGRAPSERLAAARSRDAYGRMSCGGGGSALAPPRPQFEQVRLGEAREYGFFGLALRKL